MTEALRTPQPITGLTLDQVLPLVFKSEFSQILAREKFENSTTDYDFYFEASEARKEIAGKQYTSLLDKSESPELKDFLKRNRPPTLFFEPQQIAGLLTPDYDITVNHEKSDTFEKWEFTLNPKKFTVSSDWTSPDTKQTITIVRGKPPKYEKEEPYLVIDFPARCDMSTITFYPHIKITYGDAIPREKLEQTMIKLLGLKEYSVAQQLEFKVVKRQGSMTTKDSFGRVTDQKVWNIYPVEISLKKSS